jgi:hypothetical protein
MGCNLQITDNACAFEIKQDNLGLIRKLFLGTTCTEIGSVPRKGLSRIYQ